MQNVAFDMACGRELHPATADRADDAAADHDVFGDDFAVDRSLLADGQRLAADVAFDSAVNLNVAGGNEIAMDHKVAGNNGWCWWLALRGGQRQPGV